MSLLEQQISALIQEGRNLSNNCNPQKLAPAAILPDSDNDGKFAQWRRISFGVLKTRLLGADLFASDFEKEAKSYHKRSVDGAVVVLESALKAFKDGSLQENMSLQDFVKAVSKDGDEGARGKLKCLLQEKAVEGIVGSAITGFISLL